MLSNLNPSARASVVGVIDPDAYAEATYTTAWIDMQDWFSLLAVIGVGDMVATSTVNAKFQQATDAAGAGAKDVPNSAIAALTQAGVDDNKQALINVTPADLDFNAAFRWVRLSVTVAVAASDMGAFVLGFDHRYGAANTGDLASVDEIVG